MDPAALAQFWIQAVGFKCFGETPVGLDGFSPITLLIGRNNSGKSSLLDAVEYAVRPTKGSLDKVRRSGHKTNVLLSYPLTEEALSAGFSRTTSGGPITGNHFDFSRQFVGQRITWHRHEGQIGLWRAPGGGEGLEDLFTRCLGSIKHPFQSCHFQRMRADRDIVPEKDGPQEVQGNGVGTTTAIRSFLTKSWLQSNLVQEQMLSDLNAIYRPDSSFNEILVREHQDGNWEIYLDEGKKGRIPLSQSGSGLKTILLLLALLRLFPAQKRLSPTSIVWGLEEIENNLHPALQRRVFSFLRTFAVESQTLFLVTTHSNVVIDQFARDPAARIVHLQHDGESARTTLVQTYFERRGILDDLDVRASDLLQSNGIIWVEGPSDRLYVRHWINLYSGGALQEGTHYAIVFYGGRLLAHLSADEPSPETSQMLSMLTINRNVAIVIDSDRRAANDDLNDTKRRLIAEVRRVQGVAWVTAGREIENYLSSESVQRALGLSEPSAPAQYDSFTNWIEATGAKRWSSSFSKKKAAFAELAIQHIRGPEQATAYDLPEAIGSLISAIKRWNAVA